MKITVHHGENCPLGENGLRAYQEARDALTNTPPEARATLDDRAALAQAEYDLEQRQVCNCGYPSDDKKLADIVGRMTVAGMLGATGEFSDGKLNEHDEGELQLLVSSNEQFIRLDFGKRVTWIALPKPQAVEFATVILQHCGARVERRFIPGTPATPGSQTSDRSENDA